MEGGTPFISCCHIPLLGFVSKLLFHGNGESVTFVTVVPQSHGGRKKGDPEEPSDHALGRSRGGFSTKIHLLCDAHGHPLHFHLTAGQAHESTALETLLEGADAKLCDYEGKPIAWPLAMAGDKGYRANWIDDYLLKLGIQPVIPAKENEDRD